MSCDPSVNGIATANNETDYILGPGGEQVTELAQDANGTMNWQRTYVYAGGLIATYDPNPDNQTQPLPSFRLTDWLGTLRATTDAYGVAQGTCTGLPFGDGQACSGDIPDNHHFTGKERDQESGNDYFGARYYASSMGRFMSPDWSAQEEPVPYAKMDDPQSLNLYAYLRDNPLAGVDADGHGGAERAKPEPGDQPGGQDSLHVCSGTEQGAGQCSGGDVFIQGTAQPQYGRQPDGSYKADPANVQKAIDAKTPIGNGQCVDACSRLSGVTPHTDSWTPGKQVTGLNDTTDKGLAIASFGPNGKFTQPGGDQNSAIYMGHNAAGQIMVVDQWPPPNAQKYNAPFEHPLANYGATGLDSHGNYHSYENNAYYYHVIVVP
jgi:RHS repeat-associated protein